MIILKAHDWDIEIDPENGSLFRHCRFKGYPVFREFEHSDSATEFPQWGAAHFPLLPYSNRIKNGTFPFNGKRVKLDTRPNDQNHALHGFGWVRPWTLKFRHTTRLDLVQSYEGSDWPWPYKAKQSISVSRDTLQLSLSLTNSGKTSMPAGLGFHPFFPNLKTASLTFDSHAVWMADEEVLPTQKVALTDPFDLSRKRPLAAFRLDHCYEDVGTAYIQWADRPLKLVISSSKNLGRAAVYTDHTSDSFCFEPISHTHNALNMSDPGKEGIVILKTGETMTAWCKIKAET